MTSRQPGTTPPRTADRTETPWPLVLPLTLLIILGLAVPTPKTDPAARASGRDQAPTVTG